MMLIGADSAAQGQIKVNILISADGKYILLAVCVCTKGEIMSKKEMTEYKTEAIYAALKLIEHLYKNKKIEKHIYKNILHEYRNYIDISDFKCYD